MKKCILLLIALSFSLPGFSRSTKGKEFWIGYMENLSLMMNGPPAFKLHITSDVATTCTLSTPGTGFTATFVVAPNQVYVYTLPNSNFHPMGDEAFANNGIRISANDSVQVKAFHHRIYFTESTLILPLHELGIDYLVMAQADLQAISPSEFVVLATQNNTTVEIIPSVLTLGTRPAGVAFTVTLQAGQMYQIQANGDLTGTSVRSLDPLKKIAVFGGARQANVGCTGADDHIYDQVYPITSFGTSYPVVPFLGHVSDVVKVLGSQNSTTVTVKDASTTYTLSVNKGQCVTFTINASCEVTANFPVAVAQIATGQNCNSPLKGDPGMINLVPYKLSLKKAVLYTPSSTKLGTMASYFSEHQLNVVIKRSAIGYLSLDNVVIPSGSFTPVGSNNTYSYVRLSLDTLTILQHTLSCDSGFNAIVYSFADYNFYGHHLGYHVPVSTPPNTTGLRNNSSSSSLSIFPVPASRALSLKTDRAIRSIRVIDMYGKEVLESRHTGPAGLIQLDVSILAEGVYYLEVHYDDQISGTEIKRFVKVKGE